MWVEIEKEFISFSILERALFSNFQINKFLFAQEFLRRLNSHEISSTQVNLHQENTFAEKEMLPLNNQKFSIPNSHSGDIQRMLKDCKYSVVDTGQTR